LVWKRWKLMESWSFCKIYVICKRYANICHAYQIVHKNGIPDEQVVVMMYDDIAYNTENPYQGNIINEPNGPNVYPGVLKDYTGERTNLIHLIR
uniref:Legumain n=1 Tax=Astyanax mexicanus TaxID=7994 RepID=A0A8B9HR67_ASTMX